jgi:hypothetical protein
VYVGRPARLVIKPTAWGKPTGGGGASCASSVERGGRVPEDGHDRDANKNENKDGTGPERCACCWADLRAKEGIQLFYSSYFPPLCLDLHISLKIKVMYI